nr:hypothetical protein CFP56_30900 [Quercus suber]
MICDPIGKRVLPLRDASCPVSPSLKYDVTCIPTSILPDTDATLKTNYHSIAFPFPCHNEDHISFRLLFGAPGRSSSRLCSFNVSRTPTARIIGHCSRTAPKAARLELALDRDRSDRSHKRAFSNAVRMTLLAQTARNSAKVTAAPVAAEDQPLPAAGARLTPQPTPSTSSIRPDQTPERRRQRDERRRRSRARRVAGRSRRKRSDVHAHTGTCERAEEPGDAGVAARKGHQISDPDRLEHEWMCLEDCDPRDGCRVVSLALSVLLLRVGMLIGLRFSVVTVILDACADPQEGVHDLLCAKILSNRAYVSTAKEFQEGYLDAIGKK